MEPTTAPVPDPVAQAAQDHGLGLLLDIRKLPHPLASAGGYLAGAAGATVLYLFLYWIATITEGHLTRGLEKAIGLLALPPLVFGCGFVIAAIVVLIRGSRAFYLWEAGLVYRHNSKVRAYTWDDVEQVVLRRFETGDQVGLIYQYQVLPREGRTVSIPVQLSDGRDDFNEALADAARQAGRPVV